MGPFLFLITAIALTTSPFFSEAVSHANRLPAQSRSSSNSRDYESGFTPQDKDTVRYIVTTLANSSWTGLLKHKSELKKAGVRVDHLHPFRFLQIIFTDSEMKSGVHSIRDRSKIWKEFTNGLYTTLTAESQRNNVEPYIDMFAQQLGIDASAIRPSLLAKRWSEFADVLLRIVPRDGNPGRYDM